MSTEFLLFIAILVVIVVVSLQISSFLKNKRRIEELGTLFDLVDQLSLKKCSITPRILSSNRSLRKFILNPRSRGVSHEENVEGKVNDEDELIEEDYTDLSILAMPDEDSSNNRWFSMLYATNEYLCKNAGTSAEFKVLEDICDNHVNALEDEIHNSMNVPLYLGLAGTFIGIITGLLGIILNGAISEAGINGDGLKDLLYGIVIAMSASFLGLILTVYNSAFRYSDAISSLDEGKEGYMNFLRRELMPQLSNSVAASLNSLREVLGHFVGEFGRNIDGYAQYARLQNENLDKQHQVLKEINEMNLTDIASRIARTFAKLNESADSLALFKSYQDELNSSMSGLSSMIGQVTDLVDRFEDFSTGLSQVVRNQNVANDLQRKFTDAIELHFPTGSDAREVWRNAYDELLTGWRNECDMLLTEGRQASESLSMQLRASTEYIQNFVNDNKTLFDSLISLRDVLSSLVNYTDVQAQCYKDLKDEISRLRSDYDETRISYSALSRATMLAIETMTKALKEVKK